MTEEDTTQEGEAAPSKARLLPSQIRAKIEAGEKWLKAGHYKGSDTRWKQWEKNKKYLSCVWDTDQDTDVNVNTIFSNYHTILPTLYFKNPSISVEPTQPEFKRDAMGQPELDERGFPVLADNYNAGKLLGIKINYELREINFKKTIKKVIGDCLCPYGIGWVKWGYSKESVGGHSNQRDRERSYWCRRVDPRNLVFDWMATDSEDMTFTAERIILTRKQAEKEGFDIPKDHVSVLPDFLKDRADQVKESKDSSDLIVLWECHDLESNVLYWVLDFERANDHAPQFLKEPVENPYPFEGSPYVPLVLNEDNDDLIGLSDVEPVEDQALAINRIRTKQTNHIDSFGTVTYYEDLAILDADLQNHVDTPHGAYVKLQTGGLGKVRTEPTPPIGSDNYQMDQIHKDDMRGTLGITDYQQGGAKSRTATEGQIIQNAANIRIEERRDVIYDFIIEGVRRLVAMIQTFCKEEEFINVADVDLDEDFVNVLSNKYGYNPKIPFLRMQKKEIQGEFNFKFNIEDMISRPKEVQLQQWINLLSVVGGNPALIKAADDEGVSMGKVLNKIFDLAGADIEEVKRGGPAMIPMEQENQMFLAGMEVPEPHRKDHDDEHVISHMRAMKDVEQKLQAGKAQAQQLMQKAQSVTQKAQEAAAAATAQGVPSDGVLAQAQEITEQVQQQIEAMTMELKPLEDILRRMKLHIQQHDMSRQKKTHEAEAMGMGGPMGAQQQAVPQQAAAQQVGIQSQAGMMG